MVLNTRWGQNYSLIANLIIFVILIVILFGAVDSDAEIINRYSNDQLPALTYASQIYGDSPVSDINEIWESFTTSADNIDKFNQSRTRSAVYHDENTTINNGIQISLDINLNFLFCIKSQVNIC